MRKGIILAFAVVLTAFAACNKPEPQDTKVHVTGVSLIPASISINQGESADIEVAVTPEDATDKSVKWESTNSDVAEYEDGKIVAKSAGFAIITVTTNDGHKSADCEVTVVTPIPEVSISLDKTKIEIHVADTETLKVNFVPANATTRKITWSVDDDAVASVEDGVVTGVAAGNTVVRATSEHGIVAICNVTVLNTNLPWVDGYPQGVTVKKFSDDLDGGLKCEGAYAEVDFSKNPALRFNVLYGKAKTLIGVDPSDKVDWFDEFPEEYGTPVIITNAGFFWWNQWTSAYETSSAVVVKGNFRAAGASVTGLSGRTGDYYPVRSAFMLDKAGKMSINWIYPIGTSIYTFPSALGQNDQTGKFLPNPPTKNTEGAELWVNGYFLIQGGPRLVQNGKNVAWDNTWAELLNGTVTNASKGNAYRTARTALGLTADQHLIVLVCNGDGRNGKNPAGFNMGELADKMIELGCVDAVNFDGGGSSAMVGPDGKHLVVPLESGTHQRIMPSAISVSEIQY